MNYLTSILAVPIFVCIFFFELWVLWRSPPIRNELNRRLTSVLMLVSFVQLISTFFWLAGYYYTPKDNLSAECFSPGPCNCPGLGGAEILISVFQALMTGATAWQALSFMQLSVNSGTRGSQVKGWSLLGFYAFCLCLGVWQIFCWTSGLNRRCNTELVPMLNHFPFPFFLIIDILLYSLTYRKLLALERDMTQHVVASKPTDRGKSRSTVEPLKTQRHEIETVSVLPDRDIATGGSQATKSTRKLLQDTVRTYRGTLIATVISGVLGLIIWVFQVMLQIPFFRVIACFFCLLLYLGYAARRLHFLTMITGYRINCFGRANKEAQLAQQAEPAAITTIAH